MEPTDDHTTCGGIAAQLHTPRLLQIAFLCWLLFGFVSVSKHSKPATPGVKVIFGLAGSWDAIVRFRDLRLFPEASCTVVSIHIWPFIVVLHMYCRLWMRPRSHGLDTAVYTTVVTRQPVFIKVDDSYHCPVPPSPAHKATAMPYLPWYTVSTVRVTNGLQLDGHLHYSGETLQLSTPNEQRFVANIDNDSSRGRGTAIRN